jgi:PAT family beta-lactamase induction signal transducer AmpG
MHGASKSSRSIFKGPARDDPDGLPHRHAGFGGGRLVIAARFGWFAAYATMAALLVVGILVFLLGPEPRIAAEAARDFPGSEAIGGKDAFRQWLSTAVIGPFADFMRRPIWPLILLFVLGYKLGEAMAGMMATPLYISLGFSLDEIAAVVEAGWFLRDRGVGALAGGLVTARFGILRSLMLCGLLQSAGNLFYVLQVVGGHKLPYLALCVTAENVTGAMAGTALVGYLSSLCSPAFTATQYALLSSLAVVGRTMVASSSGVLAERVGWVHFFLLTTVVTLPALLLLVWIERQEAAHPDQPSSLPALTKT